MGKTFFDDILHVRDDHPFLQQRSMRSDLALAACLLDEAGVDPDSFASGVHGIKCTHKLVNKIADLVTDAVSPRPVKGAFDVTRTGCHAQDLVLLVDGVFDVDHKEALQNAILADATVVVVSEDFVNLPMEFPQIVDRMHTLPDTLSDDAICRTISAVTGDDVDANFDGAITSRDVVLSVRSSSDGASVIARLRAVADKRARGEDYKSENEQKPLLKSLGNAADAVLTRLRDLSGYGPAKDWGLQLASDLTDYKAGKLGWDDVDKGILLSGAPGTGKTFLARALAAECDVPLITTSYSDWHGSSGGDSVAKGLKRLFAEWRQKAEAGPIILFIDEIDSIGARGQNANNDSWFRSIINSWLAFLDGAEPRVGIVVVAATNDPTHVDPALLRPGRLDRHVVIPTPTIDDLKGVLTHHLGSDADLKGLDAAAVACRGKTPAIIAQAARDARRIARRAKRKLRASDVAAVINASRAKLPPDVDRLVAVHEAGHALAAHILDTGLIYVDADETHALLDSPVMLMTRQKVEDHITCVLAGRAANVLYTGGAVAGAATDLKSATDFATRMIAQFGLGGNLVYLDDAAAAMDLRIAQQVSEVLDACDARARQLLVDHKAELFALTDALIKRRYLDAQEVAEVVETARLSDRESPHC